jgi:hypothetical protein
VRVDAQAGGQYVRHLYGVLDALLVCESVGSTAVSDDAVEGCAIGLDMIASDQHGRRPDLIQSERRGRRSLRQHDRQAHLSFLDAIRPDALNGADPALDSLHW